MHSPVGCGHASDSLAPAPSAYPFIVCIYISFQNPGRSNAEILRLEFLKLSPSYGLELDRIICVVVAEVVKA